MTNKPNTPEAAHSFNREQLNEEIRFSNHTQNKRAAPKGTALPHTPQIYF
jgi:hypothetical protein